MDRGWPPEYDNWRRSPELARLAKKYVLWKRVEEVLRTPEQIIAQVMAMGDWEDICSLVTNVGDDALRIVLRRAEVGTFDERAWHYWHYRLGVAQLDQVPPLPARRTGTGAAPIVPRKEMLPPAHQRLWPELRAAALHGFVLYGGTALALRLGHRSTVDFGFFSEAPLDKEALAKALPFFRRAKVAADRPNGWVLHIPTGFTLTDVVKVSFAGNVEYGRVGEPNSTDDGIMHIASVEDLLAMKLKAIVQRVVAKDYQDIAAILEAGYSLDTGLAGARALFGSAFRSSESLKAVTFFEGGDLRLLNAKTKAALMEAATLVRDLPLLEIISEKLAPLPPGDEKKTTPPPLPRIHMPAVTPISAPGVPPRPSATDRDFSFTQPLSVSQPLPDPRRLNIPNPRPA